jgi:CHAT domain-containing protein
MAPSLLVAGGISYDERPSRGEVRSEVEPIANQGRPLELSSRFSRYPFLAGAAAEVQAVLELWEDRGQVEHLEGGKADELSLLDAMPRFRYCHLATHGFFDKKGEVFGKNLRTQSLFPSISSGPRREASVAYRNPLLMTGIVLAGANLPPPIDAGGLPLSEDGILTAEEISGLDLRHMEMITLSACETGLGDVAAGQGVFGLQRVLHQAGVRSVVASLWKVDDEATKEFMKQFYTNLWTKKMGKAAALRGAQQWMLNNSEALQAAGVKGVSRGKVRKINFQVRPESAEEDRKTHPFFWAAFQLSGDWR